MTSVAIIGCGWLGQSLAQCLKTRDIDVVGTFQSQARQTLLEEAGVASCALSLPLSADFQEQSVAPIMSKNTWVVAITPGIRQGRTDYPEKVAQLLSLARKAGVKRLILVSSTAVLNGLTGDVDEYAKATAVDQKVSLIQMAEQAILTAQSNEMETAIIRMAGLIGEDRHPGRFLRKGKVYEHGNAPVNLIHQKDATGLLIKLVEAEVVSGVYHGVSPDTLSKQVYYQQAAQVLGLPAPEFETIARDTEFKRIVSPRTDQLLGYQYQIDDLVKWLNSTD